MLATKPEIDLTGTKGNAFMLLARARETLRLAGAPPEQIRGFDLLAGGDEVRRWPTDETPRAVYKRVLREVHKWFAVVAAKPERAA